MLTDRHGGGRAYEPHIKAERCHQPPCIKVVSIRICLYVPRLKDQTSSSSNGRAMPEPNPELRIRTDAVTVPTSHPHTPNKQAQTSQRAEGEAGEVELVSESPELDGNPQTALNLKDQKIFARVTSRVT